MHEILNSLLDKPLAFIVTLGGIIFLGLSGITKFFKVEIDTKNSKRLFWAGIFLIIIGLPIYYFGENQFSNTLNVELIDVSFYKNDSGHDCGENYIHIRETFKIKNAQGEKLTKIILEQNGIHSQNIIYQDKEGDFAINYCYDPNVERVFKILFISSSGKTSNIINYKISLKDISQLKDNAPSLIKY